MGQLDLVLLAQAAGCLRDALWVTDPGGTRLLMKNPAFEQLLGSNRQISGTDPLSYFQVLHPEDRPRAEAVAARIAGGATTAEDYRLLHAHRPGQWIRERGFPLRTGQGGIDGVLRIVADLPEALHCDTALPVRPSGSRHREQHGIDTLAATNQALRTEIESRRWKENILAWEKQVLEMLMQPSSLEAVLEAICTGIQAQAPIAFYSIRLRQNDGPVLAAGSTSDLPEKFILALHQTPFDHRIDSAYVKTQTDANMLVTDIGENQHWHAHHELAREHGLASCFAIPLRSSDQKIVGTLAGCRSDRGEPNEREQELLNRVSNLAGLAIEYRHTEQRLKASEEQLRQLAENISGVFWLLSIDRFRFHYVSPRVEQLFGLAPALLYQSPMALLKVIHPGDRRRIVTMIRQKPFTESAIEYRLRRSDGTTVWILNRAFPVRSSTGEIYRVAGIAEDITARKIAEQALFEAKELAQVTLASIGDGVITTDASSRIENLNPAAEQLTGWSLAEARGQKLFRVFNIINEQTRKRAKDPIRRCLRTGRGVELTNDTLLVRKDGEEIAISNSAAPIRDREGRIRGAVLVFKNVTQERELSRQITHQAAHDTLTGLVNRREFERRLESMLRNAKTYGKRHTLCYLELDQFKIVNDTCGHVAGDSLLRQVGSLLESSTRHSDTLARLGGDEFGLLLGECDLSQARRIAEQLLQKLQDFRFLWQEKVFTLGISIGMVAVTADSEDLPALLSAADSACYAAKENGRNRIHVYHESDEKLRLRRGEMHWFARLQQALSEDRFRLYVQTAQPIQDPEGRTYSEILLRLAESDGQLLTPGSFIPAAERYQQMVAVDKWVINKVFPLLAQQQSLAANTVFAINLSGQSLSQEEFQRFVAKKILDHNIAPQQLCFEVTETAAIANVGAAAKYMSFLRNLGCHFALDDFGSGLSSFAYLKNLPVDFLKIDGAFVKDMATDAIDREMVTAIHRVGRLMGIQTVAESVEDESTLQQLKEIGVDYAQGYALNYPRAWLDVSCPAAGRDASG